MSKLSLLLACVAVLLTGCSGGGGSTDGGAAPNPPPVSYTVSGRVQKGPFAIGSAVSINEQTAALVPTGKVYNVQTTDAVGSFTVPSVGTQWVEIVAQGFYTDELTGQLSASQVTLRALADVSVNSSPTVNALTTLQAPRLKALMSQGQTFAAANTQSESEVLAFFGIDATKVNSLTPLVAMRIDGAADSNSVLLAASTVLAQMATDAARANGTTQAAELSSLLNTLATQLGSTGSVSSPTLTAARVLATSEVNVATVTANMQAYFTSNGVTAAVPAFREWLDPTNSGKLPQRLVPVSGFSFAAVTNGNPGQPVTSQAVTISGLAAGVVVPVSVGSGAVLVKNGSDVSGSIATATNGDTLALKVTAPGYLVTRTSTIQVGSSSASWGVTGRALGGTITGLTGSGLSLQNNGADTLTVGPGSTSFSFTTPLELETGYGITVKTSPTGPLQVCSVLNGKGVVGSGSASVSVVCGAPSEQLLAMDSASSVALLIDPTTGALAPTGAPTGLPAGAVNVTADPSGEHVYATSSTSLLGYAVSASTGALAPVAGTPLDLSVSLQGVTIDPTNKFLYAAGSGLNGFTIDSTTGELTGAIAGSPFSDPTNIASCGAFCVASGSRLYYSVFTGVGAYRIAAFDINATTGVLAPVGAVSTSFCCTVGLGATVDPLGRFFYTKSSNLGALGIFTIDLGTGQLTPVSNSNLPPPFTAWSGVVLDPSGKFAYAVAGDVGSIFAYSVDQTTGQLTPLSPASIPAGTSPMRGVFDRTGKFIYFPDFRAPLIWAFAFDATTGALTAVPGSPFAAPANASSLVVTAIP